MKGYGIPRRRDNDVADNLTYGAPTRQQKMSNRKAARRLWKKIERTRAKRATQEAR
jgi:hypothetical protein